MISSAVCALTTLAFLLDAAWLAAAAKAAGSGWWPSSLPTRTVTSYLLGDLSMPGTVGAVSDISGADLVTSSRAADHLGRECAASPQGRCPEGYPPCVMTACPLRWSLSAACAHAVVVSVLTPAEILIAARRLAGVRPHLAAVAGIVHHEDLWQLCRDELTGVDVRIDGWDIRGRWFGVVVGATPRLGELRRGQTIPWRVIAVQIAPRERHGSR